MGYLLLAFSVGLLFISLKHFKSIRASINLFRNGKSGKELVAADRNSAPKPLLTAIIEFVISISAVFISFYSGYLLSLNRTRIENEAKITSLLQVSDRRIQEFQGFFLAYDNPLYPQNRNIFYTPSDSAVVNHYMYRRYDWRPYFILDHLPPEDLLTYFDSTTYYIISALEDNEKSAITVVQNSRLSFKYRRKTMDAVLKFDVFRKAMLELELLRKGKQITDSIFELNREYISDSTDNLLSTLSNR